MLDDSSAEKLSRSLIAVLGSEFFVWSKSVRGTPTKQRTHSFAFDLRKIQELQRRSGIWKLIFAIRDEADEALYDRLSDLALSFFGTISLDDDRDLIQTTIAEANLVYAPGFCGTGLFRPTLQPPSTSEVAANVITFFSVVPDPFSPESYYAALRFYDSAYLSTIEGQ